MTIFCCYEKAWLKDAMICRDCFTFCLWKEINFPFNRLHCMHFLCICVFTCSFLGTSLWLSSNSQMAFKGTYLKARAHHLKPSPSLYSWTVPLFPPVASVKFLTFHKSQQSNMIPTTISKPLLTNHLYPVYPHSITVFHQLPFLCPLPTYKLMT